jgi:hypothetical protein
MEKRFSALCQSPDSKTYCCSPENRLRRAVAQAETAQLPPPDSQRCKEGEQNHTGVHQEGFSPGFPFQQRWQRRASDIRRYASGHENG